MPKLFLVGITPDHRALVLSEHARAKRGDMVLEIDDRLLEAIDKAQRLRTFDEGHRLESAALPSKRDPGNGDGTTASRLSPREIQQRLRSGESIAALARSSGTDEAWIRRFAAPVLAEQSRVIEQARATTFTKRGVGGSAASLGPAVAANVIDRGVPLTLPDLEAGWGAYQHPQGAWHVTFVFPLRGRRQTAEWEIDLTTGELTARNKLASELGWREVGKKLPQPKPAKVATPKRAPAGRTEATTTKTDALESLAGAAPAVEVAPTPATESRLPPASADSVQELPLDDKARNGPVPAEEPAGLVRKAPPGRRPPAPARKSPAAASKAPARKPVPSAKRTAAAMTEAPATSVVPVSPADAATEPSPSGASMPPTDLDVVAMLGGLAALDDDDYDEREVLIVLPDPPDEAVDDAKALTPPEPEEHDAPTGPISLQARPQPAPSGARPAPPGGPPPL